MKVIKHKDGNRNNNDPANLELVDFSEDVGCPNTSEDEFKVVQDLAKIPKMEKLS